MLTERITKRFSKHHRHMLAYMDALEEVVRDISDSTRPREGFELHSRLVNEFLGFVDTWEVPHEEEEERLLLPILAESLGDEIDPQSRASLLQVRRDHDRGRQLVETVRDRVRQLDGKKPDDPSQYYDLTAILTELIWHFRRHVWEEDSVILPTAAKRIPASDRIWAAGVERRASD